MSASADSRPTISVITPCFNEADNLASFHERLVATFKATGLSFEWLIVDDGSTDGTFLLARALSAKDKRIGCLRLAKNNGSHIGLLCGLRHVRGACAVVMAADHQDPPEVLPELVSRWREGQQIVWAVREKREGIGRLSLAFSSLYYGLVRRLVSPRVVSAVNADFFLLDRRVIEATRHFNEANISTLMLLSWMGFRQDTITYCKAMRRAGRSGWTLSKKLKLVLDSIVPFSQRPIQIVSAFGIATAFAGLLYAIWVITNSIIGNPTSGWSSLMSTVLILGGAQLVTLGVLGEYIWRAESSARGRPLYLLEDEAGWAAAADDAISSPVDQGIAMPADRLAS